jgi:peptidyl-prolyl cis-trans isomerase A (cyclophilin A)
MVHRYLQSFAALTLTTFLLLAIPNAAAVQEGESAPRPPRHPALLDPSLADETAPSEYRVRMETTAGTFQIVVHREWAPRGADRFFNLVKIGFYNDVYFYRVIDGFMAQAGMHGDPEVNRVWLTSRIPDDPVVESNTAGRVTFAMGSEPGSRSTQFFVNFGDNSYLDELGFAPFGEVVDGFEVVRRLYSGYGEGAPRGAGPSQSEIFRAGNEYLGYQFPKLDRIVSATLAE